MICFDDPQGRRFTLRAAAIIVRDGCVLLHRRLGDDFWALPGGRVEWGETGAQAVQRELREELGWHGEVRALRWSVENFFDDQYRSHHEVGLYYDTVVDEATAAIPLAVEPVLEFAWFALKALDEVTLRPAFLATALGDHRMAHLIAGGSPHAPSKQDPA